MFLLFNSATIVLLIMIIINIVEYILYVILVYHCDILNRRGRYFALIVFNLLYYILVHSVHFYYFFVLHCR